MKIETIKDYFKEIEDEEAQNRTRWLHDLRFGMASDQWPEKLKRARMEDRDGARPCLTVNKIPVHARQIINDMRFNRAAVRVLPVDDEADIEAAEILQGMIRHIEHASTASQAYDDASEYQVFMGVGYWRVIPEVIDPLLNYQELRIRPIKNPFSVYFDPYGTDKAGADAKRAFVTEIMPNKQFEKEYPDAQLIEWDSEGEGDDWSTKDSIRIAEHYYLDNRAVDYVQVDGRWMKATAYEKTDKQIPVDAVQSVDEPALFWQKFTGAEILEERELPGRYIPIVRAVGEDYMVENERYIHGIVRRAIDAQRLYNYSVSVNAERNALQPKAPWIVAAESVDGYEDEWANANNSNLSYLTYNATTEDGELLPPPQRQFPTGIDGATIQMMQNADADLQSSIGQFAASLGAPSNEKSGIAIQQRQRVGDIATYHYTDNMSKAIQHTGRILVDLIPHYYDTERVARILGEDDSPSVVQLSPNTPAAMIEKQGANGKIDKIYNLNVGRYDVAVTVGPSFATKRQDMVEHMSNIMSSNPNLWAVIGDLLIKNTDIPGADSMAKRLKNAIPQEIRQDDEDAENPMDPEVAAQFQQLAQVIEQQGQAMQEVQQQNAELQATIDQKLIEREQKNAELDYKYKELGVKEMELQAKAVEATAKLEQQAQKQETDYAALVDLVNTATLGSQQNNQILASLAQSQQQASEMLQAVLMEMTKPRQLTVETDNEGNVVGGISQSIQ